jgi:HPt (histidine-containing phosphotransfer) domain-containing protein
MTAERAPGPDRAPEVVDLEGFRRTMREAGVEDAVDGILKTFVDTAQARIEALGAALAAGRPDDVARAAHAFKSAAGAIGASALADLLLELELAGKDQDLERIRRTFPATQQAAAATVAQVRAARSVPPVS